MNAAGPLRWSVVAVAGFVVFIHAVWLLAGDGAVNHGGLADGDSYLRLLRVTRLVETGDWFDSGLPRINAPFGGSLHWTRPLDAVLIALALPLAPALGFGQALYWAGVAVSPLMHVLAATLMVWAVLPVLGRTGACVAGALTAAQFGFLGYATAGHADHHMLFAPITVLVFGFILRLPAAGRGLAAGAFLGMGLWVGTEALVLMVFCLSAVAVAWLSGEDEGAEQNVHICVGLAASLALVLLIERGPAGYFDIEYDRVSIVHLVPAALLLAFWCAVHAAGRFWRQRGFLVRLLIVSAGAAAVGAAARLLYPLAFLGPWAVVDPELLSFFEDYVLEHRSFDDIPRFLINAGGAIFALPWILWRAWEEWRGPQRWAWVIVAGGVVVYVALSVHMIRWSLYAGLFLAMALADLVGRADAAITARMPGLWRAPVKVVAILFLVIGPSSVGVAAKYAALEAPAKATIAGPRACRMQAMARYLNRPKWAGQSRIILASVNFGPEILYRTRHRVVSTIHHRNAASVFDGVRILGGEDEAESLSLVRRRGIDLILLCPNSGNDGYFLANKGKRVLYRRLQAGDMPAWVRETALPKDLENAFLLFEVVKAPGPGG